MQPTALSLYPRHVRKSGSKTYPIVSGRELYEAISITGLNRAPIGILCNYILAGVVVEGNIPEPIETYCERQLVDGTLFWVDEVLQDNIREAAPTHIMQLFPAVLYAGTATNIIRCYDKQKSGDWLVTDTNAYGGATGKPVNLAGERVRIYPNGLGVLYYVQWLYRRIEEIIETIRKQQTGPNAKTYIKGFVRNVQAAKQEMTSDEYLGVIPGDWNLDRGTNTDAIEQLQSEYLLLLRLYYQHLTVTDIAYQPDRPSGADRYLLVGPMLRMIEVQRKKLNEILAFFDAYATFERMTTAPVADRLLELQLLESKLSHGWTTPEVAALQGAQL